jgi:hypothetical protein
VEDYKALFKEVAPLGERRIASALAELRRERAQLETQMQEFNSKLREMSAIRDEIRDLVYKGDAIAVRRRNMSVTGLLSENPSAVR